MAKKIVQSRAGMRGPLSWLYQRGRAVVASISLFIVYAGCALFARTGTIMIVEGREKLPRSGPLLLVAHHFHHLYDGCALVTRAGRQIHILVALDWLTNPFSRAFMETCCRLATWPVVLRNERLIEAENKKRVSAYHLSESRKYLRRALTDSVRLLRSGEGLAIFPEAYPTIDPEAIPREGAENFLPFRAGFTKIVELAERDGKTRVTIVPTGLHYTRLKAPGRKHWQITVRFGAPLYRQDFETGEELGREVERWVKELSS